jgi:hypothetical protein
MKIKSFIFAQILLLVILEIGSAEDEFKLQGRYLPYFFAELLDAEMYARDTIYVVGVGGFIFFDVSNISNPSLIGRFDPGSIYTRFYNGIARENLAIGAARDKGLFILSIADLTQPYILQTYLKEKYSYESIDFNGDFAYAAVHENGLEIINIKNPSIPVSLQTLNDFTNAWDVFLDGDFLYVADGSAGIKIFSLEQPEQPRSLAQIPTSGNAIEIIVADNKAFIALGAAGFDIIDVSDPSQPVFLANYSNPFGIINHLSYSNNIVFAAGWELVYAVDISNPNDPQLLATEDTPVRSMGIATDGQEVYVSDWATVQTYLFTPSKEPDIHIRPSIFDFGFPGMNNQVQTQFEIFNLGESELNITKISFDDPKFSVAEDGFVIPANDSASINVTFTAGDPGYTKKTMSILSNDPDEEIKTIFLYYGLERLMEGETAPDFRLVDLYGKEHNLSDYRGQTVLLAFFASW